MRRREFLKGATALAGISFFTPEALSAALGGKLKTIVIGATAEGCAMALRDPENTLILERGIHPAPEFLLSLDPETLGTAKTDIAKEFETILESEGLVENNKLYHQPAADLFTKFLDDKGVRLLFLVEFVSAQKSANGNMKVTVCGNGGKVTFEARKVIDFRSQKVEAMSGVLAKKGSSETMIFRVAMPEDATISSARLKFHEEWEKRAKDYPGWELIAEAGSLKYVTSSPDFLSAL